MIEFSLGNVLFFKDLQKELKDLEQNGIQITILNANYKIFFRLCLILGDNLGLHSIFNFTESFMCNYPCRFCKCNKSECNFLTVDCTKFKDEK